MSPNQPSITVLGAGKIGFAIALLLQQTGDYRVRVADQSATALKKVAALGCETMLLSGEVTIDQAVSGQYAVLNALPFRFAFETAQACIKSGAHYFDLTEDVQNTQAIRAIANTATTVLMPQCGLAPGFIGVAGYGMAQDLDEIHDVKMRVGALPRFPSNGLKYNLTWSTEGLINEYCNPCEAIVEGKKTEILALEGLENFVLDGVEYEAFNTSGGLGTLPDTLAGRARNVDYKSIRYPGHQRLLKILLDDLRLRDRRDVLADIFDHALPATDQDVIVIFATATGMRDGRLIQTAFKAAILGQEVDGHTLSAIQLTTACGICCALDLVHGGHLPKAGFVGQEAIALDTFLENRFGGVYGSRPLALAAAHSPALAA